MRLNIKQCFVDKGWGYEEILINTNLYCAKILHLNMGKMMSWHYHNIKDETFYVENGLVKLYYSNLDEISEANVIMLRPGDIFNVPTGVRHRLVALENSRVFEFSTQHFDEDSIRLLKGD